MALSKSLEAERRRLLQGFPDIEYSNGDLKTPPRAVQARSDEGAWTPEKLAEHAHYAVLAGRFRYSHKFADKVEREIWHLHAEGVTYREIAQRTGTYVRRVNDTINRLRAVMLGGLGGLGGGRWWRFSLIRRVQRMDSRTLLQLAPLLLRAR